MELILVIGDSSLLLPRYITIPELHEFLPEQAVVFEMPWYSRTAGRYYHERLLEFEADRRLEAASLALEVESSGDHWPVLIFPSALDSQVMAERVAAMLRQMKTHLGSRRLTVHPYRVTMTDMAAITEPPAHFAVFQTLRNEEIVISDLSSIRLTPASPNIPGSMAANQWASGNLSSFCKHLERRGLSPESHDRAISLLAERHAFMSKSGMRPSMMNPDKLLESLADIYVNKFCGLSG
ncbi:hypothetical protein [Celeribacter persicus]|uniref:Uncharacterized protein n=1 Tax=Celeribacter persicus TaxID=1651082 RepID=A0A2T5HTY3_9RHOB|nr:hypothetical protein [Celeribacter persicus]PTQ74996.1 hypothetical protein C8N42_103289 [Celeribacter persicus]